MPPKNVRVNIEKTAGYVARNGAAFEERLRGGQAGSKMTFLLPEDAYHSYYRWRIQEIKEGRGNNISAGRKEGEGGTGATFAGREERKGPEQPEEFQFSARMPNINAQDLEVVKLTALFVAKNGRSWMTALSQREAGNFQFDFLRPQHSLYQFFSRLVDQYTDLLTGDSADGGRPQKKRITELEANVQNRFRMLDRAKKRAEWVKYQESQKVAQEEKEEKEKIAYAQIDWHDFVVVETVVFDERDDNANLPAPTTLNDLQSASLEQKAAMRVGADRRIEEAMPTFEDYDSFYNNATPTPQQPAVNGQRPPSTQPTPVQNQPYQPPPQQAQQIEEQDRLSTLQADRARARAAQEAARTSTNPMKIRKDYVPAAQARAQKSSGTSICPNCKQAIPNAEMAEHMRIELLDPNWREQYRTAQHRSSTTNLSTADVANNLKRLASQRTDVFDPVTGLAVSEEELERRKRAELGAYDGISGVPSQAATMVGKTPTVAPGTQGAPGADGKLDVQEQIRLIHERARNG